MKIITKYRLGLWVLLFFNILAIGYVYYTVCKDSIPDSIHLAVDNSSEFDYKIPAIGMIAEKDRKIDSVNLSSKFVLKTKTTGKYTMEAKLFGFLKLKEVAIESLERQKAAPSGQITGIYIETDGLFVIDTAEVETDSGIQSPAKNKLRSGDYIMKINGKALTSKMKFMEEVNRQKGEPVILTIMRKGKLTEIKLRPVLDEEDNQYKIGAYIRNNTQGIGTITYTQGNRFAALGHGISDIDLGSLLSIRGGEIYQAEISSVKKGAAGSPGEIVGIIDYNKSNLHGTIEKNTENGIFGTLMEKSTEKSIPIAFKQEVRAGKAWILSDISGERQKYEIEITSVDKGNNEKLKGMQLKVTDPKLKKLTNGIVQGMSGSPIIQDDRLVGAVTHVFVSDPTKGYGIFIEEMLEH
ncbi:MAG: SpoIVB peptidase [Anaerostipes sp.]|uniref:SpoIVB peptidase n=1 Tax=Anaerostipes sp. 992a TaxID=1261637 RepID=UPI000952AB74|nr:SpoIVB peptidase [Anaerostipes sp. 992a]MCI5952872.1 SpoIVB peptidase [Anaerostipes sp.]MDD5969522.1 SpoIVB peptidase [Anaerostipes sp.]OLR63915.1 SpoIVB peptidase [Anaerostipes sp. 992a]